MQTCSVRVKTLETKKNLSQKNLQGKKDDRSDTQNHVQNATAVLELKNFQKILEFYVYVERRIALIGSAWYGGEMKKGIFSMMHYWLPQQNCLSIYFFVYLVLVKQH